MKHGFESPPSLQQLYPSLSADELWVASENIDRYLHVILRICKRLEADKCAPDAGELNQGRADL
jgi:hypothetical protein